MFAAKSVSEKERTEDNNSPVLEYVYLATCASVRDGGNISVSVGICGRVD